MAEFNYKSLTKEELATIFKDTISFSIDPMWHQLVSLSFASTHDRVAYWHGVGTGKTLLSLWTTELWKCKKVLVVCPSSAFSAWERDITTYTDKSYVFLTGSGRDRKAKLKRNTDIAVINYEGLKTVYCSLVKKQGWKINYKSFIHDFDGIILDEVHRCKAYGSLQTKICFALSKKAKHVIGLTGTAFDSDLLEPFNIYKVIDLGKALGLNFFTYRSYFFKPSFYSWELKNKKAEEKILRLMARSTISFDREECFDLPDIQEVVKEIEPSPEFIQMQHKIITTEDIIINGQAAYLGKIVESADGEREMRQARAPLLRELTGGFIYYKDDKEDKVNQTFCLKKNAKMEALIDLIDDTSGKLLVFYLYQAEGAMLQQALKKNKINFRMMKGGQKINERGKAIKDFTNNPDVKVMLVQISTGAEGWDGSAANVIVFYTLVASPKVRKQCVGRAHRKGQKNKCLVVDLMLKRSVDITTLKHKEERTDFVSGAMKFMREYGGIDNI